MVLTIILFFPKSLVLTSCDRPRINLYTLLELILSDFPARFCNDPFREEIKYSIRVHVGLVTSWRASETLLVVVQWKT